MFEIDFLPVEAADGPSSKSGDAIAARFTDTYGLERVIVIDAGFKDVGQAVVDCVRGHYGTSTVDLVISTHPDSDHLNGLETVIEQLDVDELLVHRPRLHARDVGSFPNLESLDSLIAAASRRRVRLTEPFAGLERFGGALRVLGPTESFYEECLREQLSSGYATKALIAKLTRRDVANFRAAAELLTLPTETLDETSDTTARNESSVVTLLTVDDQRLLFTGDAGAKALGLALDEYEAVVGPLVAAPLDMVQVPHHGSRRNVTPSLLDRLLGPPGRQHAYGVVAVASSALADEKHPHPQVTNAFLRRGAPVTATEGRHLLESHGCSRYGWSPVAALPPLTEDVD
jgi:beta-lactamase superfamily II metal-dependent hydrolase